jgi:myo-inositol-1(or 4)-monophosphatase
VIDREQLLATALEAARAGADVVMAAHRSGRAVAYSLKGQNDFVTAVDREAESAIVGAIRRRHPDHGILAEESAATDPGGPVRWIIDPLDGTTNFIHGFPVFSVAVAAAAAREGPPEEEDVLAGVILDPVRGETFTAVKGKGAFLGGERLAVAGRESLETCLLTTGFPFRAQHLLETYLAIFKDLHHRTQGIRRAGSAALDLAYTACGRADGFFEFQLRVWDIAAGTLLVREAGGAVADFSGGKRFLTTGDIVAGNRRLVGLMLDVIGQHCR